jgi:hypothetical protein
LERCWFGFLLTGVLLQGLLGHAGETTQAKIERSRQSHNPCDDRTHSGGDSDAFFDHRRMRLASGTVLLLQHARRDSLVLRFRPFPTPA